MVADLIDKIDPHTLIIGIYFTASSVYRHKDRLNPRGGLGHQAGGPCRGDGE